MVLAAGGGLLDGWGGMVNRWSGHVTTGFEPSTQPPYTAADTMPTHGGPGRFDTVAGLLAATPPQLRLLPGQLAARRRLLYALVWWGGGWGGMVLLARGDVLCGWGGMVAAPGRRPYHTLPRKKSEPSGDFYGLLCS